MRPMDDCPDGEYVLLKFSGPFHDTESTGVAVGKVTGGTDVWLTCIWAGSTAHAGYEPIGWWPLPALSTPTVTGVEP